MQPYNINYSKLLFWTDAQISSSIAKWLIETFGVQAASTKMLQLMEADDEIIFMAARKTNAILILKDRDIPLLLNRFGPPPKVIWLTCGNTSNKVLKRILQDNFKAIIESLIINNDPLIEITD